MIYKVVMLGVNKRDNIIMKDNLTYNEAIKLKNEYKQKDSIHYYEVISNLRSDYYE